MSGFKSTYLSNLVLGLELGNVTWTPPSSWYLALFTVLPNSAGSGGTEVPIGTLGYNRTALTNGSSVFGAASGAQVSNIVAINCGTPTGAGWGTIVGGALYDASSGGNMYRVFAASPSITGTAGLVFTIPIGSLIATES